MLVLVLVLVCPPSLTYQYEVTSLLYFLNFFNMLPRPQRPHQRTNVTPKLQAWYR